MSRLPVAFDFKFNPCYIINVAFVLIFKKNLYLQTKPYSKVGKFMDHHLILNKTMPRYMDKASMWVFFLKFMNLENELTRRLDNSRIKFVTVFKRTDRKRIILFFFLPSLLNNISIYAVFHDNKDLD